MALLEIRKITKRFGGLVAVDSVTFEANAGEIVGLIGPNGAGKSTVFNLITGFFHKDNGEVIFKGKDISKIKPYQISSLGLCRTFQLTSSFSGLTVFENIRIAAQNRMKSSEADRKTRESIELVGLQGFENQVPGQLPHGFLKRLDIARTLAAAPELILLDEPFSGLSVSEIRSIANVIRDLQNRGITLVIIEHVLRELMPLANKIVVLSFGKKLAEGPPKSIVHDERVIEAYLGKQWDYAT